MPKVLYFLIVVFGFYSFYRYDVEGYPFEDHFDSFDQYELPSQSEIYITSTNGFESWSSSLWQSKGGTENAAQFEEFKDKNIVHLMTRPLQVYYLDSADDDNITNNKAFKHQICHATVSAKDIYHTLQTEETSIDILFICSSGRCCGLDCCHLNITFIFTISCIFLAIASFACYFIIRTLSNSKKLRRLIPFLKLRKHHRIIKRTNAQRKGRVSQDFDLHLLKRDSKTSDPESPPIRKKSHSVRGVPTSQKPQQQQLPEILLSPPTNGLCYSNSVPSKHQRKTKDEIL